ncbi:MAG: DUF1648 domain-containing protein [Oscillospiraceae bacterium]|nr:DUF1648 domain-containing protein [Oscillospiraceae bacterium]
MNKKIILIHRALFWLNTAILAASLVFFLLKWNGLPDEIGIHFDAYGNFDVTASKYYGFYPHVVGAFFIIGIAVSSYFIKNKSSGLKISEKGELLFRSELLLTLDMLLFIPCVYFSQWAYSVSVQKPLNVDFFGTFSVAILMMVLAGIVIQVITCRKYRINTERREKSDVTHRICRLTAWLLTVSGILVLILVWERLQGENGTAYFANFDADLDKKLLLIPHLLVSALLVFFEVNSVRAVRAGNHLLVSLTDSLKLICGVFFFWWNIVLASEMRIGIISVSLFVLLCTAFIVRYLLKRRSKNN